MNANESPELSITIKVDMNVYKQDVITAAAHKFTGKYFVSQNKMDNIIHVTFTAKPDQTVNYGFTEKEFGNELIDQQVRYDTEQRFAHIRNLIVEKAFSPINHVYG